MFKINTIIVYIIISIINIINFVIITTIFTNISLLTISPKHSVKKSVPRHRTVSRVLLLSRVIIIIACPPLPLPFLSLSLPRPCYAVTKESWRQYFFFTASLSWNRLCSVGVVWRQHFIFIFLFNFVRRKYYSCLFYFIFYYTRLDLYVCS